MAVHAPFNKTNIKMGHNILQNWSCVGEGNWNCISELLFFVPISNYTFCIKPTLDLVIIFQLLLTLRQQGAQKTGRQEEEEGTSACSSFEPRPRKLLHPAAVVDSSPQIFQHWQEQPLLALGDPRTSQLRASTQNQGPSPGTLPPSL